MRKLGWFGRKRIGIGIGPVTWEGLAVMAVFVLGCPIIFGFAGPALATRYHLSDVAAGNLLFLVWVAALVAVMIATYDADA